MRQIGDVLQIDRLQFYDARHAFADIARNKCGLSKDDIALALNHKDNSNSVTDVYLSKDWKIVDKVQRSVLLLLQDAKEEGKCYSSSFIWKRVEGVLL